MSYYDDLGVQPNASPENIRDSYRALARLLHPDGQIDEGLRGAAEAQMRRINQGYAVLGDEAKRRRYDADMMLTAGRTSPSRSSGRLRPLRPIKKNPIPIGPLAWTAAAVVCCGVIFWLSGQGQSAAVGHAPAGIQDEVPYPSQTTSQNNRPASLTAARTASGQPASGQPASGQPASSRKDRETIDFLKRELQIVRAQRDAALAERRGAGASRTQMEEVASMESLPVVSIPPPEEHSSVSSHLDTPFSEPAPFQNSDFAGFWIYPKSKNAAKDPKLYPPDYIETAIVEHDGTIRGKYRARYNISDRAISPNVIFEFEGRVTGTRLTVPWKGEGGSKGEVELKLLSGTELEVNWKATSRGRTLALINGTAILMRRPD